MKKLLIICSVLTGCSEPNMMFDIIQQTAPGAPLPQKSLIGWCKSYTTGGKCTDWSTHSDKCVNPKGIDEPKAVVQCSDIVDGKYVSDKKN